MLYVSGKTDFLLDISDTVSGTASRMGVNELRLKFTQRNKIVGVDMRTSTVTVEVHTVTSAYSYLASLESLKGYTRSLSMQDYLNILLIYLKELEEFGVASKSLPTSFQVSNPAQVDCGVLAFYYRNIVNTGFFVPRSKTNNNWRQCYVEFIDGRITVRGDTFLSETVDKTMLIKQVMNKVIVR